MSRLAAFIHANEAPILAEWESFARTLTTAEPMDIVALRDHAAEMLQVIVKDLERPQSDAERSEKARGESDATEFRGATAAQAHGTGRAGSGFTAGQMMSEFRALRASVTRLWCAQQGEFNAADLHDLIRFNEAIDQAIAESVARFSQTVEQTQERFLAILSHDLRTPLGAIITSTAFMIEGEELAEPYRSLVARVGTSARRMNQMVVDLLEFARTRFGDAIPIVREQTDVRKLTHDVVLEIAATYPSSTVQLEISGELRGEWDGDRLAQALTNLVGNAVQHGSKGTPIKVIAQGLEDEVVISVHNQGPVIAPDQVAKVFQAGARGRGAARDRRHLGLGLYIVDKIVTAHGGRIAVRSTTEEGTSFTIHLPRTSPARSR